MNSLEGGVIIVRAIHFAATAITTGSLFFWIGVAEPALRSTAVLAKAMQEQIFCLARISLAIAVVSGSLWVLLLATNISSLSFAETIVTGVLLTVINETLFGFVLEVRLALAVILALCLVFAHKSWACSWVRYPALASALGLMASIAWTGHAASTVGSRGILHLMADGLHLLATAAWIGGLLPLILMLMTVRHHNNDGWMSIVRDAVQRFSTLGIISVGILIITGVINTWLVIKSFQVLIATDYGHLLMFKIVLFAALLVFASANRFWWTPQLAASGSKLPLDAVRRLTRNSVIELVFGLVIFAVVGALGTLHPAIDMTG